MKNKNRPFLLSIVAVCFVLCWSIGPLFGKTSSRYQNSPTDQDIVYSEDDVDVKAEITNLRDINPIRSGASHDCGRVVEVKLTMILRKSGKVTDAKVVKSAKCSLDSKAIQSVKRAKFKPAQKNGATVSQLSSISFRQTGP